MIAFAEPLPIKVDESPSGPISEAAADAVAALLLELAELDEAQGTGSGEGGER